MKTLEQTLQDLKTSLSDRIAKVPDPVLRQLWADYASACRVMELARGDYSPTAEAQSSLPLISSNAVVPEGPLTRGDACVEILREHGQAMHVNKLTEAIKERFGFDSPARNLVAILKRDSLNRFINTGGNVYKLNEAALAAADEGYYPKDGTKPLRRRRTNKIKEMGITLKQAILMAVEAQPGEFKSADIYENLQQRFPKAAVNIHVTSVDAILRNIAKDGVIKETAGGRGGTPKRFIKRLQLVDEDEIAPHNAVRFGA